jgi:hypothetical protein
MVALSCAFMAWRWKPAAAQIGSRSDSRKLSSPSAVDDTLGHHGNVGNDDGHRLRSGGLVLFCVSMKGATDKMNCERL